MFLRSAYYSLSPKMRLLVRKIVFFPIDFFETITNKRNKEVPKKGDIFIGSGDYVKQGNHQLNLLQHYTDLNPNHHVLDVGCGIGRTAFALKSYLHSEGKYDGFDVVEKGINWCQKNISAKFSNFKFKHIPLYNDLYMVANEKAESFRFPYESESFDTVFLFSVFTHMQPSEVENYLSEINRVLKVNGKCLATFFVYNNENQDVISDAKKGFAFPYDRNGYKLMNEKVPSANIAFSEDTIQAMMKKGNFTLQKQINGSWKKAQEIESLHDFQDVLVFQKK